MGIGDAIDLARLAQAAPVLAAGLLLLAAAAWIYRQARRGIGDVASEARLSAARQGKRIGELEIAVAALDLYRRQLAYCLAEDGVEVPFWPPDGPDQPRTRRRPLELDDEPTDYAAPAPRVPVPPLPDDVGARHRRPAIL